MLRRLFAGLCLLVVPSLASAEITAKNLEHKHHSATLEAVLVYDNADSGKRPGVLLVSELGASHADVRSRAGQMAKGGYAVLCVDLYGKGISPANEREAAAKLGVSGKDRSLLLGRMNAAFDLAGRTPPIDSKKIAAIGFGHGGTAVLELFASGADLEGVVSVHGDVPVAGAEKKKISGFALVIVEPTESRTSLEKLNAFEGDLKAAGAESKILRVGGSNGEFPPVRTGKDPKNARAQDAEGDKRVNDVIKIFLSEELPVARKPAGPAAKTPASPKGVPEKAMKVLAYVDKNGEAMEGYEGGRNFGNFEKRLPQNDEKGRRIKYREWDVNPLRPGVNRGAERLVTGSDGSAHYTDDHYNTFKKIR